MLEKRGIHFIFAHVLHCPITMSLLYFILFFWFCFKSFRLNIRLILGLSYNKPSFDFVCVCLLIFLVDFFDTASCEMCCIQYNRVRLFGNS